MTTPPPLEVTEQISLGLFLVPLLPLFGAILLGQPFFRHKSRHKITGWIASALACASFVLVCSLVRDLNQGFTAIVYHAWTWFEVGSLRADFTLRLDRLAAVMSMVVTGVGTLIHVYAIGYMEHDEHRPRFFCYLNLFLFSMLLLVLGDNLLLMFVGWEGVGLCSYLLIGFWFREMDNANAGQKAFVVNRIGDAGFLLGMFTLVLAAGTFNFGELEQAVPGLSSSLIELAALLLFIGAVGKSAQIPLYVWLPDAMAGPTPVSALIHAATMVTAGVYMITRMHFVFAIAPNVLLLISAVGTLTAFVAATIALVQNDIKKVLAYSTVSQLGYMFMALGAGAFSNGIYHVVTHAFFKACLFMAAGSVIIGCHHEQDMRRFGGLWDRMRSTFLAYLVATLAISGIPLLSGFYSKDAILWTVFSNTGLPSQIHLFGISLNHIFWGVGVVTAFLTAFYMTRSLVMTFFGKHYRGHGEPHESPWTITVPLGVLLVLSAGYAVVYGEALMHYLYSWTRADMRVGHEVLAENSVYHTLEIISGVVAVSGVGIAFVLYLWGQSIPVAFANFFHRTHRFLLGRWWVDELYAALVVRPLLSVSSFLFRAVDRSIIDALVNGAGILVIANGEIVRRMHTGKIGLYASLMSFSAIGMIIFWLLL